MVIIDPNEDDNNTQRLKVDDVTKDYDFGNIFCYFLNLLSLCPLPIFLWDGCPSHHSNTVEFTFYLLPLICCFQVSRFAVQFCKTGSYLRPDDMKFCVDKTNFTEDQV